MSTSLEGNKILAGILAAGLLAMATGKIADTLRQPVELAENVYKIDVAEDMTVAAVPSGPAPVEPILGLLAAADPAAGENAVKKCAACHSFDEGGKTKVGPNLWNIVNAPKASKDGYTYSAALAEFSDPKEWTYSSLNKFLYKPKDYIPGTKMGFAGVKRASERANIIAYMRSLAATPAPLPTVEEIQAAQEVYEHASGGG